ncbi:putative transcription factor AS2-LOB family [Helianthus annuus]|nr:putative transcription factor AS2-LOB family [Helianthus annuus]
MSCNGCRVLRKGCEDDCILRPCLSWITSSESQANATLFLAKFYGRTGLLNLISAGPRHLRPEIFKSLLHEACGRIMNPTYGSVGLMWSGNWEQCQAAVDSVLQGSTIKQFTTNNNHDTAAVMPLEGCDIRHLSKVPDAECHRVKIRNKFKRPPGSFGSGSGSAFQQVTSTNCRAEPAKCKNTGRNWEEPKGTRAISHKSLSVETVDDNGSGKVLLDLTLG